MKTIVQKITNRQESRFAIIGAFNTALDFAILIFLAHFLGVSKIIANTISTGVCFVISFFLNKKITFESAAKSRRDTVRELTLFTLVTLFGLWVIQGAIIWAIVPIFERFLSPNIATLAAKIPATAASLIWNFVMYKKVVFREK